MDSMNIQHIGKGSLTASANPSITVEHRYEHVAAIMSMRPTQIVGSVRLCLIFFKPQANTDVPMYVLPVQ